MRELSATRRAGRRKYRLFGLTLATDFRFASRLTAGEGREDLRFSVVDGASAPTEIGELLYESPFVDEGGESLCRLYRAEPGELLSFGGLEFQLDDAEIDCRLHHPESRHLVEIRLLGPVLAYWLERLGVCALHASAVVVGGRAVVFLAGNQGGKSGLAAALMSAGAPLLSDDVLPVEAGEEGFSARPGYPQMRMWPDMLESFVADWRALERVHPELDKRRLPVGSGGFGTFHDTSVPPAVIYLPERRPAGTEAVRILPLSAREALIELVRRSFSPFIVEAAGLQPARLELLGRLASRLPVKRLVYPSGVEMLPRVRATLLADLRRL